MNANTKWMQYLVPIVIFSYSGGKSNDSSSSHQGMEYKHQLTSADGREYSFDKFKGRVTIISFVGLSSNEDTSPEIDMTRAQMTFLRSVWDQYSGRGLQMSFVTCASDSGQVPLMNEEQSNFLYDWVPSGTTLVYDTRDSHLRKKFSISRLPSTILLGRDGELVKRWNGLVSMQLIVPELDALLGHPHL